MKISFAFLVLVTVTQLCTSNVLSKRGIQKELSSDGTENGIQNGSDVIMVKAGPLDVVLTKNELVFEVCEQECNAEFLVCFETDVNDSFSTDLCDTKCGYYVNTNEKNTIYMHPFSYPQGRGRPKKNCTEMVMSDYETEQKESPVVYRSCHPKIENGIVKLTIMNATDECRVSVKNAKIKRYDVVPPADARSPTNSLHASPDDDSSAASYVGNFGWIFVLISFCILYQ